jgi:hypothetical protein
VWASSTRCEAGRDRAIRFVVMSSRGIPNALATHNATRWLPSPQFVAGEFFGSLPVHRSRSDQNLAARLRSGSPTRAKAPTRALPRFLFFPRRKTLMSSQGERARKSALSSTSGANRGVPAGGPRHRRRRCATRTNEGTLKGTRLRLFFAADGPPADDAGTLRHAALASRNGARATRIPASNRSKRSLIAGSSRRVFALIHHASKGVTSGFGWRSRIGQIP